MNSWQAKRALVHFLLWEQRRTLAMTEFRYADVFAVTKAMFTEEIEVKVDKGDLRRELEVVSWALGIGPEKTFAPNKRIKHQRNMEAVGKREVQRNSFSMVWPKFEDVPNRFYFAVTSELEDLGRRGVRDTPYGLIVLTQTEEGPPEKKRIRVEMVKSAENLHKNKTAPDNLVHHMRKVCLENLTLMEKL